MPPSCLSHSTELLTEITLCPEIPRSLCGVKDLGILTVENKIEDPDQAQHAPLPPRSRWLRKMETFAVHLWNLAS